MTDGDRLFQRYLRNRGLDGADEHEPDLGGPPCPDFLVRHAGGEVLFEVKSIERTPLQAKMELFGPARQSFTMGPDEVHKPIRSAIKAAARQLKPYQRAGRALVVVITNPNGVPVDLSEPTVLGAMYGDPGYVVTIDPATGGATGEGRMAFTRNGKLTADHRYLSGVVVAWLGRDGAAAVEVYETIAAACNGTAEPLPRHLFDGPGDRVTTWRAEGDWAVPVGCGP